MKGIGFLLILVLLAVSCGSTPPPLVQVPEEPLVVVVLEPEEEPAPPQPEPVPPPEPPPEIVQHVPEPVFDPQNISEEKYTATKRDVQDFILELNMIIREKNYREWLDHLAGSYLEEISSPDFLEKRTEELYNRDQIVASNLGRDPRRVSKTILRTPKDYFDNVVVPSRSNDRMDDIDFISENQVKAYTVDSRGNRLVLYNLELIDGHWKIIN